MLAAVLIFVVRVVAAVVVAAVAVAVCLQSKIHLVGT
jgi:hypothetical protein